MTERPIVVIGAGVSGLTCGVRLLEEGNRVEIWARDRTPNTTSDVAAAAWYPPRREKDHRVDRWLPISLARFTALAGRAETGVVLRSGLELFRRPADDTWWRDILPGFRRAQPEELPDGFVDGFVASGVPVIEMPIYLRWLSDRFTALGGRTIETTLADLAAPLEAADVVVNCSGAGARALVGDDSLVPVRGQVVRVAQFGLDRYILDEQSPDGITYMYPRSNDVVLGGTRQRGDETLQPDPEIARAIVQRCARLDARVSGARILSHGVGLRPGRDRVRLETEEMPGGRLLVHDYGHGGSGVTLSWGCAEEVVRLISEQPRAASRLH
ncbi:MAG TPA: FAD-dependent oxidoreductase [Actinomycetota bacterium]|nr:FAD-dependent oxidoreductase [Actinomycetota bacterium]